KLLVFIWLSNQFLKKLSMKKMIKYILIGVISLYVLAIITSVRDVGLNKISMGLVKEIIIGEESPIIKAIFEMGGSLSILSSLMSSADIIDQWNYGNTYISAVLGVISTRILTFFDIQFVL